MVSTENVKDYELSLPEVGEQLPIGEQQIRRYVRSGKLKARKVRNKWKVKKSDLEQFKIDYEF